MTEVRVIERDEVPAGSFRYGQLTERDYFDVAPHLWAVCTGRCFREDGSEVIVAHFLFTDGDEAATTAANLSDTYEVWLVKPKAA